MFGRKDSWAFQIGRYEAMNLFPLGKDVALFYADGADSIGSGIYYYMAKEGRGRGGDAGQARIIGEMGNWTAEVSTVYGDTESVLENSSEYLQGVVDIDSSHNSFMVRPAVNYLSDDGFFSISFGGEYEVNGDYVTATNTVTKEKFELSDRYGLAATTTLNFGELVWNNSIAMQDAKDAWEARTFNTNTLKVKPKAPCSGKEPFFTTGLVPTIPRKLRNQKASLSQASSYKEPTPDSLKPCASFQQFRLQTDLIPEPSDFFQLPAKYKHLPAIGSYPVQGTPCSGCTWS
ncbi:carbohydrate porin [Endozoicomonas sp. ALB091]|uniref:carbohydrate porin n=1 Tax=Endozoicomonas sp. ALB091 TaxID=3403073 RepID=UPI003BB5B197